MSIRERLDTLSRAELAGLVAVLVVTLAGAGLWFQRSLPRPVDIATSGSPAALVSGSAAPGAPASVTVSLAPLIVDVAGLVRRPGVYEFAAGDRVIDAVERAGGAQVNADLSLLNLAAPLTDGQQIVVPKQGTGTTSATGTSTTADGSAIINVNTADATALEVLQGIGEVLAGAIVQYREEHGPFMSVDQLEDVSGIGPATLEEIRDQVTI